MAISLDAFWVTFKTNLHNTLFELSIRCTTMDPLGYHEQSVLRCYDKTSEGCLLTVAAAFVTWKSRVVS